MKTNELLRRYVDDRSEPAFEELVKQHIDLVYSAALRQVNGDVPAAQDVTQAVFTDLARKAPRLLYHTSLAGWLYTSTRYLAAKALRSEQCRRSHEQEAHEMNQIFQSPDPDTTWQELRPLLDDAMHDLSATDREAVLMRYFERLPLADIGARLGLKENAVHMRVERALDRLRAALASRGVTSTVTALNALLTGRAVGGAPAGVATRVSRAAFGAAAAGSGLGWGLLKLAGLIHGKVLVASGGVALVAALIFFVPQVLTKGKETVSGGEAPAATRERAAPSNGPSAPLRAGAGGGVVAGKAASSNGLVLHIVANDSGKPIAGATIIFWTRVKDAPNERLMTNNADDLGRCEIPLSRDMTDSLLVRTRADGFVDTSFAWIPIRGERIPRQYTLRLARSVPIGGQVVNEDGAPVAGAEVSVYAGGNSASADNSSPPHVSTGAREETVTDINGRWHMDRFARTDISTLGFQATHPNYATNGMISYMNAPEIEQERLAGAYTYTLDRGVTVTGIVVDPDGHPVSGARVAANTGTRSCETTNQQDGTFTLNGCKPGSGQVNVEARGFALATVNIDITSNQSPLRLELSGAKFLRLRVMNTNGMPVPNATVSLNFNPAAVGDSGSIIRPDLFRKQTDADGRFLWDSAPEGRLLFDIEGYGYERVMNVAVDADGEEHVVTLPAARTISGSVRDAATGQPISPFRIVTGRIGSPSLLLTDGTNVHWGQSKTFRDGMFRYKNESLGAGAKYKFEADGYAPFVTRVVDPDEGNVSFDIVLYTAFATTITVLLPDGQPATNVSIGLDIPGTHLNLKPGGFSPTPPGGYNNVLSTDNAGRFVLPPDDTITRVVAASPDGYAEATPAALATEATMRLQPWGRLEGAVLSGGKPAAGRVLKLMWPGHRAPVIFGFFTAETDADGHFVFPEVPPGRFSLFQKDTQVASLVFRPLNVPEVAVRLGETTSVSLALYTVTARLSLPAGSEMETNWNMSAVASQPQLVDGQQVSESLKESRDGTWAAEDLPAGDYTLSASVRDSTLTPTGRIFNTHMQAKVSFTVPSDSPGGTLDLGDIMLQPVQ